jgi:hypothetical protein
VPWHTVYSSDDLSSASLLLSFQCVCVASLEPFTPTLAFCSQTAHLAFCISLQLNLGASKPITTARTACEGPAPANPEAQGGYGSCCDRRLPVTRTHADAWMPASPSVQSSVIVWSVWLRMVARTHRQPVDPSCLCFGMPPNAKTLISFLSINFPLVKKESSLHSQLS